MNLRSPYAGIAILSWLVSPLAAQHPTDPRIGRALNSLRPPVAIKGRASVQWTLAERMAVLHVPGITVAIIDSGRVVWAHGFGVKQAGTSDSVTARTLFQAQSISKPVAVTAMLRLMEAGKLSLDQPVNQYLKSWRLPDNRFTAREAVTLRRVVSHSAGINVGGFPGYRLGDAIPTLTQILNGQKPANNPPIRVDTFPGAIERYSGGGLTVMQQLLIDVTGQPFPLLMKQLVLDPAGMAASTFEQPLPQSRRSEAASGHDLDGAVITGKWPIHPEMAAAGLWTTPTDLGRWALQIAEAWSGRPGKLVSQKTAAEMLTVQKEPVGLGVFLEGKGRALSFGHTGSNRGFRAEVVMFPVTGQGAVAMTNSDQGSQLTNELFQSIAAEYHWPGREQIVRTAVTLGSQQLDGLVGGYHAPGSGAAPVLIEVTRQGERLFFEVKPFRAPAELYPATADSFFTINNDDVAFRRDASGRAHTISLGGQVEGKRK